MVTVAPATGFRCALSTTPASVPIPPVSWAGAANATMRSRRASADFFIATTFPSVPIHFRRWMCLVPRVLSAGFSVGHLYLRPVPLILVVAACGCVRRLILPARVRIEATLEGDEIREELQRD